MYSLYKERPEPTLTKVMSDDPDHRPNQNYQGAAQLHPTQQSPNVNSGQSHQPPYAVQGVFSPSQGLQSPYLGNPPQYQQHPQSGDGSYYGGPNQSPRSTTSAYYPSDKSESMAAATAPMQRTYPQIYHTPQSNSPASVTSPQVHDHGRPIYAQQPQMQQPIYASYQGYQPMGPVHQSPYGGPQHPSHMNQQPILYPPNAGSLPPGSMTSQAPNLSPSPRIKNEPSHYVPQPQTHPSSMQPRHSASATPSTPSLQTPQPPAPPSTSNAAPGPIPATTPLVVRQDQNGVQWIAFEYSRDRVKMEYTIRCDVESVDASQLSQEFKGENCVYPRACVPKDQYKGNRLAYETDCNQVGWALADLNPCLRGKRGLIQRAVDSWRNSNQDPRLRSRRVRRQAKMNNRSKVGALSSQAPSQTAPAGPALPGSGSMAVPSTRTPGKISSSSQQGHHQGQHDISPTGQESIGAQNAYSTAPGFHRSGSTPQHLTSPSGLRQVHTFPGYGPAYPTAATTMGPSMAPSMQGSIHGYGRPGGNATMGSKEADGSHFDIDLYGDIPGAKRRKFILVDDTQNDARVRVKAGLDQIDMTEIPDSYRKHNSVFPRAYFPVQMQSTSDGTSSSRFVGGDFEELDDGPPVIGRTTVPCVMTNDEGEVPVLQLSRSKRDRERKLNELGYRMAWGQSRVFANRPIFLGRALDVYRNKHCEIITDEQEDKQIPPHLETRPGKRRWHERTRHISHGPSPAAPGSS